MERFTGNPRSLSPAALAFLGDAVYELMVREELLKKGGMPAGKLHILAVAKVRAAAQAGAYGALEAVLAPEEADILRRGRNASTARVPKGCTAEQYRKATAIETLFGYLHLKGAAARLEELFTLINTQISEEGAG